MELKRKESTSERVSTKEREFEDDCFIHVLLFAAGVAVLMACFKRALMVFLLEEWRLWMFLFLNLVLLSILFTSTLSATPKEEETKSDDNGDRELQKKKIKMQSSSKCCSSEASQAVTLFEREDNDNDTTKSDDLKDEKVNGVSLSSKSFEGVDVKVSCREDEKMEAPRLSKAELNERAEAFIVMFRQHLVLDAKKCGKQCLFERPRRSVERVKFQACAK